MKRWIQDEHPDKIKSTPESRRLGTNNMHLKINTEASKLYDCGVFTLMFAALIARNLDKMPMNQKSYANVKKKNCIGQGRLDSSQFMGFRAF